MTVEVITSRKVEAISSAVALMSLFFTTEFQTPEVLAVEQTL